MGFNVRRRFKMTVGSCVVITYWDLMEGSWSKVRQPDPLLGSRVVIS
jgi:hypothetical protein